MSEEKNEGKSVFYKKQKLSENALRVQKAVTLAAGSLATFENEDREKGGKNSSKGRKPQKKRRRKNRKSGNSQNRKESTNNRQNHKNEKGQQPQKPVNSQNSMEERLDYYRKKYGEDFQSRKKGKNRKEK